MHGLKKDRDIAGVRRILPDKVKSVLGLVAAWLFLNILMNLNYPAPQKHLLSLLQISPEISVLTAVLWAAAWLGLPLRRSLFVLLTLLVLFFRIFRIADAVVPMYFFRPFNLYIDSQFLVALIRLLYKTVPLKTFFVGCLESILLAAAVSAGVWWSVTTLHRSFARLKKGRVMTGTVVAVLAMLPLLPVSAGGHGPAVFHKSIYHRMAEEIDFILHVKGYRREKLGLIEESGRRLRQTPSSLNRLAGADVYLFFIESYGRTMFANKDRFERLRPLLKRYESDLSSRGFSACSGYLRSPTFGGSSWLAHGTLASGVALSTQLVYDLLVTSDAPTLARLFNRAGYRTVSVMPANEWPWPAGQFFGYRKHYYAWDFDYRGPRFGWSPMPDQYVLQDIYRKEIAARTQPLFIEFVLTSSHAPFNLQPRYLQDWSKLGDGSIYRRQEPVTFPVIWPDLTNAGDAYAASIIYDLKVLKHFIEQKINDDALVIILGDHQPNVQITGPQSSWSVPVHVISRNQSFLEPFLAEGYTPGLVPSQPRPHPGMETFLLGFVQSFSSPESRAGRQAIKHLQIEHRSSNRDAFH